MTRSKWCIVQCNAITERGHKYMTTNENVNVKVRKKDEDLSVMVEVHVETRIYDYRNNDEEDGYLALAKAVHRGCSW